ncbi:protein FAF-like, chloroplastic [Dioscorea cayenensis subsp. rotundata]|uniref:Protein FAF-like, chloroplastic n=1 Tax=Dioscorea cayennensis subsp. rotundata TaxID=55577 RepID=A0AB40BHE3_DIOCR|nr:protein FAF-like, chloroplastic [Dioscorea cayenensis subsp. rotundata]
MPVAAIHSAPGFPSFTDVWTAIQAQNTAKVIAVATTNLFHRSLGQFSLETCTESLGSETGSDVFYSDSDIESFSSFSDVSDVGEEEKEPEKQLQPRHDDDDDDDDDDAEKLLTVNYHCSISKKSPVRSFPPPLPSISRRDGPCLSMRPHRRDGRLVMEAVQVPSQNYLHAERHDGRLLLSFVHSSSSTTTTTTTTTTTMKQTQETQLTMEEEEEQEVAKIVEEENKTCAEQEEEEQQEEVEVVDRGTVVELKMSTQPHRSSFVINKFVGGLPEPQEPLLSPLSTNMKINYAYEYDDDDDNSCENSLKIRQTPENKMLFMLKGRNRGELLHRCSHLWRPLLIWEPYCIATSS